MARWARRSCGFGVDCDRQGEIPGRGPAPPLSAARASAVAYAIEAALESELYCSAVEVARAPGMTRARMPADEAAVGVGWGALATALGPTMIEVCVVLA